LASLFLILSVAAIATIHEPTGFLIDIAAAPESCGDGWNIVATLLSNHTVQVNSAAPIEMAALPTTLRGIFKTRAERVLFLRAAPEVPFQVIVDLIGKVQPEVDIISLITPKVEERVRTNHCLVPGCGACTPKKAVGPWFTGVRVEEMHTW